MKKAPCPKKTAENTTISLHKRLIGFFAALATAFSLLYLRVGWLTRDPQLTAAAQQQKKYTLSISVKRGEVYDREFRPLTDRETKTVYAVLPSPENLLPVLEATPLSRRSAVSQQFSAGKPFLLGEVSAISAPGVESFSVPVRTSSPQLAAHIVGYLDDAGKGVTGIEKSCDSLLSAQPAETQVVYTLDGWGRGIAGQSPEIREEADTGGGIVLSLDENIQKIVENAGQRGLEKGAVVVMDPYTGDILAAASFPSYRPDRLAEAIQDKENTPMINRAFLPYSVGSTFKVVTAAAALEAGLPVSGEYDCTGQIDVSGQLFRCHKRSGHGEVDMIDAMMKSCNPYFIQLGLQTGGSALLEMAQRFGFGQKLPLAEGISAAAGTMPEENAMINPAAVANLSFGQGELTATPLQIARMTAAVVNGGLLLNPRLVLGSTPDGKTLREDPVVPAQEILSPRIAAQLQSFLIHCVMVEDSNALPDNTTAGGKTATAQTGRFDAQGDEYEHGWFTGFFPAASPKYVVTVLAENSGFGNSTAAPVFAEIAKEITAHGW